VTDANEREWLAERFEQHRARLRAVAHRILGSIGEAEDAVQDAWLRRHSADTTEVENLDAWLDHGRGTGLPEHAARTRAAPRGTV
jgi:DNA-directed RNA polymerase specialized sigma24 family protein